MNESRITNNYYHFIDTDVLNYLSENDFSFKLYTNNHNPNKYAYSLSLTRNYDFKWTNYRIAFDSYKLSMDYKISPYHYFNNTDRVDFDFKGDHRYPYEDGTYKGKGEHFDNQYEELLLSKKEIIDLKKYIIQIDILNNNRKVMDYSTFNKDEVNSLKKKIEHKGLIVNIVNEFKPIK